MSDATKVIKLQEELNLINSYTRHSNFKVISAMYYDKISPPGFQKPEQIQTENLDSDQWDYVRFRTLELLATEIRSNQSLGSVAEVGVFRGDFASEINRLFPKRKLYLFDTFEGFEEKDIRKEIEKGRVSPGFCKLIPSFAETSVNLVIEKMPFPKNCVVCKGRFPESAKNIIKKEIFCLVSIDLDFYESTLDALFCFYPQIVTNGYILLHDYNHDELSGPKQAFKKFKESVPGIHCVPVADQCGTLVLIKS